MQDIDLHELRPEELNQVHRIEQDIYPVPWTMNFFRIMAHTVQDLFLVVSLNDEVVGYAVGEVESRGGDRKTGHVMNLAVKESYRRRGIGTLLMDELERRFIEKGVGLAYLEVRESNVMAQSLYRHRGYVYLRKVGHYYGDEDGLVLTKSFNGTEI
ncbi:MAG: ribosomal protein S18-alanine N-acetyltransferase [Candidatus Bathyarchaeota archaeon]|nr:ribosomal protein S18-alanine N-acetyltransferase [Candidatus Bathyarchaeota archaeon]